MCTSLSKIRLQSVLPLLMFLMFLVVCVSPSASEPTPSPALSAESAEGKQVFVIHCSAFDEDELDVGLLFRLLG